MQLNLYDSYRYIVMTISQVKPWKWTYIIYVPKLHMILHSIEFNKVCKTSERKMFGRCLLVGVLVYARLQSMQDRHKAED